jgi:hypothetical protein
MEKLSDLPTKEVTLNDKEEGIMQKYFGENKPKKSVWKLVFFATILFLLLSLPLLDGILCRVPYCGEDNFVALMGLKASLFATGFLLVYYFMV